MQVLIWKPSMRCLKCRAEFEPNYLVFLTTSLQDFCWKILIWLVQLCVLSTAVSQKTFIVGKTKSDYFIPLDVNMRYHILHMRILVE